MKSCQKLFKNCSIHGKNPEISDQYNFWTPIKNNVPDVWNWNCWTFFGLKVEVRGSWLPSPIPSAATPLFKRSIKQSKDKVDLHVSFLKKFLICKICMFLFWNLSFLLQIFLLLFTSCAYSLILCTKPSFRTFNFSLLTQWRNWFILRCGGSGGAGCPKKYF